MVVIISSHNSSRDCKEAKLSSHGDVEGLREIFGVLHVSDETRNKCLSHPLRKSKGISPAQKESRMEAMHAVYVL